MPMESTKYDFEKKLRERQRFLDFIPPLDDVFIAAAKSAWIQAGLSQETIDILHPPKSEPKDASDRPILDEDHRRLPP
jgi:hypothetical protein